MVVDVALTRGQDNPQLIFESMNSTGRELSQADLIRNFVLMGLEPSHQTKLYDEHWRPMELAFGQESYGEHFDSFMRHYLTLTTGDIPNVRGVYEAFKAHARSDDPAAATLDSLALEIHQFARYYCAMALGKESDADLRAAFQDLKELKVDVAYPLLLGLYHDYKLNVLSKVELLECVRLLESYVFRRAVCGIPPNSLNKTLPSFLKSLNKKKYVESFKATLLNLPSYRRMPNDEEFKREIAARDLYNFPRKSYCLRRLENHNRKERVPVEDYTIEHILPQNLDLSAKWREALGPEWQKVQERWVHTLGNLTLTGYNSEYSDRSFQEKRDMKGGFKESPLRLNEGIGAVEKWDESAIRTRAARLSEIAKDIWQLPALPGEVLAEYQPKREITSGEYTIADHPHLSEGSLMKPVFDKLRTAILALDPCVTEEFRKLYVAYKAETNFVDIVPQAKRLRLTINLEFHELRDSRNLARDVTNLGRWGNGDVDVGVKDMEEIPYVMGLIRQAFEKQMT